MIALIVIGAIWLASAAVVAWDVHHAPLWDDAQDGSDLL